MRPTSRLQWEKLPPTADGREDAAVRRAVGRSSVTGLIRLDLLLGAHM